jgi:uncharacterized coiled-coil DUF342 family protein
MDDHAQSCSGIAGRSAGIAAALGLAILVGAAPVHAQQGEQGQGEQMQQFQQMQQMQQELQQIRKQLRSIRQKALQDSSIRDDRMALEETVRGAMTQLDPNYTDKEDTLNAIQRRLQQAQQNQDTAQLRSLMSRGRQVQQQVQRLQDSVTQRDSIAEQLDSFRDDLISKMIEIDPQAEELMDRRDSIMNQLRQMSQQMRGQQGGQQGPPPGPPGDGQR